MSSDQPYTPDDLRERELDYWMGRAYNAEARERRLAAWMEHLRAEAHTGAIDEMAAILDANDRTDQAEARIEAVRDVLDTYGYKGAFTGKEQCRTDLIRRALDG